VPTAVFQSAALTGNYTIISNGSGYAFALSLVSGSLPSSNIYITSAAMNISQTYQYSKLRLAIARNENTGADLCAAFTTSGNSASSNVSEQLNVGLYTDLSLYGSNPLNVRIRGAGKGSSSSDGNVMSLRVNALITVTINWEYSYTACGAPTAVSISATNVAPGAAMTLSWSGASAGISNGITGYQIYQSDSEGGSYSHIATVSTSAGSGSTTVTAPSGNGSSYYYKVLTLGSVAGYDSGQSSAYAALTCSFSAPSTPSTVTIGGGTSAYAAAGTNVTLAWSGAGAGTNNPITGHHIYRDGAYYAATTGTSYSVPAHGTAGNSYTYTVYTLGTYANSGASTGRTVYTYGAPAAPTTVSVSDSNPDAGTNVTLSWSGAGAGSYNATAGYQIYRATYADGTYNYLGEVSTISTSGSMQVTAHATMGLAYYYKVYTVGARSNSTISSAYAPVTSKVYTACSAPTTVSLSAALANVGTSITLSWSGAVAGTNNPVSGYAIYRSTSAGGTYSLLGTTASASYSVAANTTEGSSYYYKIVALGTKAGFNSGMSSVYATLKTNSAPSAPTISAPVAGKTIINSRPRILVTVGSDADGHAQTLSLTGYSASTVGALAPGKKVVLRRSAALTESSTQNISITSADTLGAASGVTSRSFSYTAVTWTDSALVVNTTPIKAVHMQELRTTVDQVRAYYGLSPYSWAESLVAEVTSLAGWTSHVIELRTAMESVAILINGWDMESSAHNITLPVWIPIPVNKPTADVMAQLREAVLLL
jgi:hypothetical protein